MTGCPATISSSTTVIASSASGLSIRSSPGRGGRLRLVPIQGEEGERLLHAMDREARLDSWHLTTPTRRMLSAGAPPSRSRGRSPAAGLGLRLPLSGDHRSHLPLGCGSPGSLGAAADRHRLRAEAAMAAVIAPLQPRHGQPRRPRNSTPGGERRGGRHRWPSAHRRPAAVSDVSTLVEMLRRIPHGC